MGAFVGADGDGAFDLGQNPIGSDGKGLLD